MHAFHKIKRFYGVYYPKSGFCTVWYYEQPDVDPHSSQIWHDPAGRIFTPQFMQIGASDSPTLASSAVECGAGELILTSTRSPALSSLSGALSTFISSVPAPSSSEPASLLRFLSDASGAGVYSPVSIARALSSVV
jgi:hypothetical protein